MLEKSLVRIVAASAVALLSSAAMAAKVPYTFQSGALSAWNPFNPAGPVTQADFDITNGIASALTGSHVTGSFYYNASSPLTGATSGGSLGTRGSVYSVSPPGSGQSSFGSLSATVSGPAGGSIHDPAGFTIVGDEAFQLSCPPPCVSIMEDYLQLQADSANASSPHNFSGFSVNGFTMMDMRIFWIEGQGVPSPIGDFLNSSALPGSLPAFNARLALDFASPSDPFGKEYIMFYDSTFVAASVPEPQTYALILAGLALFGFARRGQVLPSRIASTK